MSLMPVLRLSLHLAVAAAVVAAIAFALQHRRATVAERECIAAREQAETQRIQDDIARARAQREALRADDAFAVELLARERLGWGRIGELRPPPVTGTIDNPRAPGNR